MENVRNMIPRMRISQMKNSKAGMYDHIFSAQCGFINTMVSGGENAKYLQCDFYESPLRKIKMNSPTIRQKLQATAC